MGQLTRPKDPLWVYHEPCFNGDFPAGAGKNGEGFSVQYTTGGRDDPWWPCNGPPMWLADLTYRYRPSPESGQTKPASEDSGLPDGNPKTAQGALKTPTLSVIPAPPLIQVGEVMRLGRDKYGAFNWRDQSVTASTYVDAAMRHLMSWWDGETIDQESGQSHLAHAAASLFVIMDALATGHATDDRPKVGVAADLIAALKAQRSQ